MSTQAPTQSGRFPEFFAFLISAIRTQYQLVPDWLLTLLFPRVERIRNRVLALMEKLRARPNRYGNETLCMQFPQRTKVFCFFFSKKSASF
jgi:hypothetical protein